MTSITKKMVTRWLAATAIAMVITFSSMGNSWGQDPKYGFLEVKYGPSITDVNLTLNAPANLRGYIDGTPIAKYPVDGSICNRNGVYGEYSPYNTSQVKFNNQTVGKGTVECLHGKPSTVRAKAQANAWVEASQVGNIVTGYVSVNGSAYTPLRQGGFASAKSSAKLIVNRYVRQPDGTLKWKPSEDATNPGAESKTKISSAEVTHLKSKQMGKSIPYLSAYSPGRRLGTFLAQVTYPNADFNGDNLQDLPSEELPETDFTDDSEKFETPDNFGRTNNIQNSPETYAEISTGISYNIKNPLTNETVIQGDFVKIKGVFQGSINLDDDSIDFIGVNKGTFQIEFPGRYTNKRGNLLAIFERGCLTQAQTDGIFSGWLPPIGTCGDFSITNSTAPNFGDFNFDYKFANFPQEVDFTLELSKSIGVGLPKTNRQSCWIVDIFDYLIRLFHQN